MQKWDNTLHIDQLINRIVSQRDLQFLILFMNVKRDHLAINKERKNSTDILTVQRDIINNMKF